MRGITTAKVEGHSSLIRDLSSNAIISTSESDYDAYKLRRDREKSRQAMIENQTKEIEELKSSISEIKQMLIALISNKG